MSETTVTARAHVARAAPRVRAWLASYGLLVGADARPRRLDRAPHSADDRRRARRRPRRQLHPFPVCEELCRAEALPVLAGSGAHARRDEPALAADARATLRARAARATPALGGVALLYVALGFLAHETSHAARGLTRAPLGIAAGGMVLAFGAFTWFAASGMEVVPLAWLLMRSAAARQSGSRRLPTRDRVLPS